MSYEHMDEDTDCYEFDDTPPLECTCEGDPDFCEDDNCKCWICHVYPYAD